MSAHTTIQWCDSTVNPTSGCDGCELWNAKKKTCYAGNLQETRMSKNPTFSGFYAPDFNTVRLLPGRVWDAMKWSDLRGKDRPDKPWLNGRPRHIFIGDLSDIFSAKVDFEYLRNEVIEPFRSDRGMRHVGMLLTKRPQRLVEFAEWLIDEHNIQWPSNIIAMTSVTSQATAQSRIPALAKMFDVAPLARLMISAEPLLEAVDLTKVDTVHLGKLDGIICGLESGEGAEPGDVRWLEHMVKAAEALRIPCFVKQLGAEPYFTPPNQPPFWLKTRDKKGGDPAEWPIWLRVRALPEVHMPCHS